MTIYGRKIAKDIIDKLQIRPTPKKFLGVILVGDNVASEKFIGQKRKIAEFLNIDFRVYSFPESIQVDELRKKIGIIARGKTCGGLIIQLPLPSHLNRRRIVNSIPKGKDLDVLSESAYGQFLTDQTVLPPSVSTFCEVLSHYQVFENHAYRQAGVSRETNLKYAIVGNGFLVGRPISDYLRLQGKQLVVLDKGDNLSNIKDADVIVLGAGVPNLVDQKMIKDGALIVDFGCSFVDGKLCGDLLQPKMKNFYIPQLLEGPARYW